MSGGFVYFAAAEGLDAIRIGFSVGPDRRVISLQCWSPVRLTLLCVVPGTLRDEKLLHWLFRPRRIHGDWFAAAPEILTCIAFARALGRIPVRPRPGVEIPKLDYSGRKRRGPWTPEERANHERDIQDRRQRGLFTRQIVGVA